MKIRDVTSLENINTITMAMETNGDDFDTEDKLLAEILERIKKLTVAAKAEQAGDERESQIFINFENDIDDLLNMVGMNYYIRGIKMGARLCSLFSEKNDD